MINNTLWKTRPDACTENIITGRTYRFTLLTGRLIRMEYQKDGLFEDRPTQVVWNRCFEKVAYKVKKTGDGFELFTDSLHLFYDGQEFSGNGLYATSAGIRRHRDLWRYGEEYGNLGGTTRTLDRVDGACSLDEGIMSESGYALLDDSRSLVLRDDGWVEPRRGDGLDLYLFAYGDNYRQALKDFYRLTGEMPMLPRYALGNWWSRFYRYSEESYIELMDRFRDEKIPFTVAVIDMDWHLVDDVDPRFGSPWTGFTWNRKLFPDPERFLGRLHERGMKVTLNLHPADGIRAYEDAYQKMADALKTVNTDQEEPIDFDITNPEFLKAYFSCVLHPEEDWGVDFWWVDWQQGNTTRIPGLDPLWMLNHFHYLDSARDGKRPMTFSRYAGPGSHRYPVGFSGDTIATWESLQFQPYFTSTASNIGYGWWSHDIGGHMLGYRDNEMALRWLQFGVFSPINRMHSSNSEFNGKEPWNFPMETASVMGDFFRLRHEMIPYLYTMNYRACTEGLPLILPMYYDYPEERAAYQVKNQYLFGDAFIVAPITTPRIKGIDLGKVMVWLPEGLYIDFFTGLLYQGGRMINMYRDMHSIPVLAKAGAIVPMTSKIYGEEAIKNPDRLIIHVYAGENGSFTLYEDDNETVNYLSGDCVTTDMKLDWERGIFSVEAAKGNLSLIPPERIYEIRMYGLKDTDVTVRFSEADGSADIKGLEIAAEEKTYDACMHCLKVVLPAVCAARGFTIELAGRELSGNDAAGRIFDFLRRAEINLTDKEKIFELVQKKNSALLKMAELQSVVEDEDLAGAVAEIMSACEYS